MPFSIKKPKADRLARKLAATGESLTDAVTNALKERLERVAAAKKRGSLADRLDEIAKRCPALPVHDARSADEILAYNEHGLPH